MMNGSLVAVIADEVRHIAAVGLKLIACLIDGRCAQDTITGFLLAGCGNIDLRKKANFLVVDGSKIF